MSIRTQLRHRLRRLVLWAVADDLVRRSPPGRPDVLLDRGVRVGPDVRFGGDNPIGAGTVLDGPVELGACTTVGQGAELIGPITVGRWCQLAPGFGAYAEDHPTGHLAMYMNRRLLDGRLHEEAAVAPIRIGHGVWAGRNATVPRGVTVGNGAVLAAGAVVTDDVEPYAIVGGVPARTLRHRFDPETIAAIEALRWWEHDASTLAAIEALLRTDLTADPAAARQELARAADVLGEARPR